MVKSQIKFWVFGAVGVVGVYVLTTAWWGTNIGLGLALVAVAIGGMILGTAWNLEKQGERAATYRREARDEEARQELQAVRAKGLKQIEQQKPRDE